jgi:hypothetical protein
MLTQERVRQLFRYEDGKLIRRVRAANRTNAGDIAGCKGKQGYLVTCVDSKEYLNHRLVFLYHHGYVPETQIDHIDRDRTNNRIENLREITQRCNSRNCNISSNNKSGITGVCWYKRDSVWKSQINLDGKAVHLGYSQDLVEAVALRLAAEQAEGWPECHSGSPAYRFIMRYLHECKTA